MGNCKSHASPKVPPLRTAYVKEDRSGITQPRTESKAFGSPVARDVACLLDTPAHEVRLHKDFEVVNSAVIRWLEEVELVRAPSHRLDGERMVEDEYCSPEYQALFDILPPSSSIHFLLHAENAVVNEVDLLSPKLRADPLRHYHCYFCRAAIKRGDCF